MAIGTLQSIINKVRRLTGTANSFQLTDSQIIDYINSFYLYDFPAQFRSLKLKDRYTFNTIRGIDTYPFDFQHYTSVEGPVFVAKRAIPLYQDTLNFYSLFFNWQNIQNIDQGDGTTGPYTGTLQGAPIIRSTNNNPMVSTQTSSTTSFLASPSQPTFPQSNISRVQNILITANTSFGTTLNVTDDGAGNLIGGGSGSINYETGAVSVTFSSVVPSGQDITVMYNPALVNIPQAILFFQQQFTLRPVPDRGYTVEITAYRTPSQALLGSMDADNPTLTGVPELLEWWETLAFGAAKKIYEDRLDPDGIALMDRALNERYDLNNSRTCGQLGKQRAQTIYSNQLEAINAPNGIWYSGGT